MTLAEWAARTKRDIFEQISAGQSPSGGDFVGTILKEGRSKGTVQMGATTYLPDAAWMEFIFSDTVSSAIVLTVVVPSPERIVFMPVPVWVVETIWQGDVDGSFHFESHAEALVQELIEALKPDSNSKLFGKKQPTRRE